MLAMLSIQKHLFYLIMPLLIGGLATKTVQPEKKEHPTTLERSQRSVRVMTYNIRFDNPGDGVHAWPHRKERVAGLIRVYDAEIVGVQEALQHQLVELTALLPGYEWVGVGRNADGGGEYSALLYKAEAYELVSSNTFWLSEQPSEAGSQSWDAALPRIVTWARFRELNTGAQFLVMNTHFDHMGEEARAKSAQLIVEQASRLSEGLPLILMGDLNTTDSDRPYEILSKATLKDGRRLLDGFYGSEQEHYGPQSTWTGFTELVPNRRIDYIWASDDLVIKQHAILGDRNETGYPSDHLPVMADVALKSQE